MTLQATLCASEHGCCGQLQLGEAFVEWGRFQRELQQAVWLGTFHGTFALGPDTVEGRYLAGEAWYAPLPALHEAAPIRALDLGLLRWLARGPFTGKRVAE